MLSEDVEVVAQTDPVQYRRSPKSVPGVDGIDEELLMYEATEEDEKYWRLTLTPAANASVVVLKRLLL